MNVIMAYDMNQYLERVRRERVLSLGFHCFIQDSNIDEFKPEFWEICQLLTIGHIHTVKMFLLDVNKDGFTTLIMAFKHAPDLRILMLSFMTLSTPQCRMLAEFLQETRVLSTLHLKYTKGVKLEEYKLLFDAIKRNPHSELREIVIVTNDGVMNREFYMWVCELALAQPSLLDIHVENNETPLSNADVAAMTRRMQCAQNPPRIWYYKEQCIGRDRDHDRMTVPPNVLTNSLVAASFFNDRVVTRDNCVQICVRECV